MKVIFEVYGGLGDNLQKSTIPRMFAEQGHDVYLNHKWDNVPGCVSHIHNDEIKRLVWEMNPYLRGFSEEEPTIVRKGSPPNVNGDFIKNWETFYGLSPKNSYPEIYYKPKKIEGIEVVFELSWLAANYTPGTVKGMALRILELHKNLNCKQVLSDYQCKNVELDVEKIRCDTIYDLADVLYSAKVVITLSSGPHMLSAAIHKGDILQYCIMPDGLPEFPHYRLPGIKYEYPNGFKTY